MKTFKLKCDAITNRHASTRDVVLRSETEPACVITMTYGPKDNIPFVLGMDYFVKFTPDNSFDHEEADAQEDQKEKSPMAG